MIIAIRPQIFKINDIEVKGVYIDKTVYNLMAETTDKNGKTIKVRVFSDETLSKPPYNFSKVEIDEKYKDCESTDFNEDLTFSVEKYNSRKNAEITRKILPDKLKRLEELRKDIVQDISGLYIEDIELRKEEYRALLNEVRVLQGKAPREIKEV